MKIIAKELIINEKRKKMECLTPEKDEMQIGTDAIFQTLEKLTAKCHSKVFQFNCAAICIQFLNFNIFQAPSIKDFAIIKPISRGAFGKVFLGYKVPDAKNLYAIKVH